MRKPLTYISHFVYFEGLIKTNAIPIDVNFSILFFKNVLNISIFNNLSNSYHIATEPISTSYYFSFEDSKIECYIRPPSKKTASIEIWPFLKAFLS